MSHDVFISYSHHDKAAADAVCAKLEQHQIRCWIAPRDVVPGIEWADCIINAINSTQIMVLVFSANANDSPQIRKEVERAVHKGVIIVPLRIEDVVPTRSLEYFMSNVHWLDAITSPIEKHLDHLAGTVRMLLERADSGEANEEYSGIRARTLSRPESKSVRWLGFIPIAHRRFYVTAFAVILAAVAGGVLLLRYLSPPLKIPRLAVIGPSNNSGNPKYDYLTTQVAEIVSADLSQASKLNAIPGEDILQMRQDVSIPADPCSGNMHPVPLQQIFAASYLVFGSFNENSDPRQGNIHMSLCLLNPAGKVLETYSDDRNEATMGISAELAADKFRKTIGDASLVPQDFSKVFPQDPDASRLYFEGVNNLRIFNAAKARDVLQDAVRKENSNPLIHSALAQAWSKLRRDKEAREEANAAVAAASQLPIEFNTGIQAAAAEMNKQWEKAVSLYQLLYKSYPERLDYGLDFASVQRRATKLPEAMATLNNLAKLPKPLGDDPRILIEKSRVLSDTSDYRGSVQAAEAAREAAKKKNFLLMQAYADFQLCYAYQQTGDVNAAQTSCIDAQQKFIASKDDVTANVVLNHIATWLTERQRYGEAIKDYDIVVSINDTAHDQKDLAGALINRARVFTYQNSFAPAVEDLNRAIKIAEAIDDKANEAIALIILASISQRHGDLPAVISQATQASELARAIPNPGIEAFALSALALAKSENGNLSGALQDCNALLKIRKNSPSGMATTFRRVGNIYFRMANFPAARKSYHDAIQIYGTLQQPANAAQTSLELAEVDLSEAHSSAAEDKAAQALKTFDGQKGPDEDVDSKADVLAMLIRAIVKEGSLRLPEAQNRLNALKLMHLKDNQVISDVALAEGAVLLAAGNAKDALGVLSTAARDAVESGQQFNSLQLRLMTVQAMDKLGEHAEAKKALLDIKTSAQHLGFKLISNQADELARLLAT
jgi:tetratricopeptide (TPR) repeat protein